MISDWLWFVPFEQKLAISVDRFATLDDFIKRSNRVWVAGSAIHQKCRQCQSKANIEECNFHLFFTKGRRNSPTTIFLWFFWSTMLPTKINCKFLEEIVIWVFFTLALDWFWQNIMLGLLTTWHQEIMRFSRLSQAWYLRSQAFIHSFEIRRIITSSLWVTCNASQQMKWNLGATSASAYEQHRLRFDAVLENLSRPCY